MPPKKRKLATSDLKSEAADGLTTPTSSTISTPTSASTSNGGALSASAISLPPSNNNSNPSSIVGISRSISACQRCRAKKIKCDQRFPKCSKCEKHGVECIGLDPLTGREVPRSYIVHLEERIKFLESKLKANGIVVEDSLETLEPSHTNDDLNKQQLHQQHDDIDNDRKKTTIKGSIKLEPLDGPSTISFSRLMSTAFRVQKKSLTNIQNPIASRKNGTNNSVSSMNNNINSNLLPAILPPKITALQFISIFFAQSNSQLPILHREEFIKKYFIPIYGKFDDPQISLANDYSKINFNYFENDNNHTTSNSSSDRCWFEKYKDEFQSLLGSNHNNQNISNDEIKSISNSIIPPKKYRKGLYFLNLIFAIASSVNHLQYPITISDSFRLAANKHFDEVYSSPDQLESLSGILLYSLYSTMRPTNPGVWYILGSALRMCVDLDLHNELNTNTANHVDSFTKDKRRRLFWCTYCVDRQICFYLDRPVGIPDESINTPFLSELDDSFIVPNNPAITDYSTITNDVPTYKVIFLSIIKIRQIQSEVQRVLYTNYPLSGKYKTIADWKSLMLVKLASWKSVCPSSPKQMNCNFNLEFFRLNYHHTLLMLHGLSPKNYKLASKDYIQVFKSAQEVMDCYSKLCQTKSINYTWAAVHNLFMAGTSYLYSIYNSEDVRQLTSLMEMKRVTSECLNVLNSLVDRCDAATNCIEIFQNLTRAIFKLRYNEVVQGVASINISKESLLKINNGNVNSNLSMLVEILNRDKTQVTSSHEDTLNPFKTHQPTPGADVDSVSSNQEIPNGSTPINENINTNNNNNNISNDNNNLQTLLPTFEWLTPNDLATASKQNNDSLLTPMNGPIYDLDTFFKELDNLSPISTTSRRNSAVNLRQTSSLANTPIVASQGQGPDLTNNMIPSTAASVSNVTNTFHNNDGTSANNNMAFSSTGSSPLVLSNSYNSKEGRKAFELIHQLPNEIIWDEFFTTPSYTSFGSISRKSGANN